MIIHTNTESGTLNIEDSATTKEHEGGDYYEKVFMFNDESIVIVSDTIYDQEQHRIISIGFVDPDSVVEGYYKMQLNIPSGKLKIYEEINENEQNVYMLYPCLKKKVVMHFKDGIPLNQTDILIER